MRLCLIFSHSGHKSYTFRFYTSHIVEKEEETMDENIIKNDSNNKICENSTNSVNENATNIMNSETSYTSQGVYESVNSSNPVFYTAKEGEVQPEYEMNTKQKKAKKQKKEKIKKPVTMGKVFATCVAFLIITVLVNTAVI